MSNKEFKGKRKNEQFAHKSELNKKQKIVENTSQSTEEQQTPSTTTTTTTAQQDPKQVAHGPEFLKVSLTKPMKEKQPSNATVDATVFEASKAWSDLGLGANIIRSLEGNLSNKSFGSNQLKERLKFPKPTKIQTAAIPVLLQKKDTLIKAHTGSGKTLSYGLAIIQELQSIEPRITRTEGTYGN
jgi:ATP-dependent helicase YprA (DUF1998 family)